MMCTGDITGGMIFSVVFGEFILYTSQSSRFTAQVLLLGAYVNLVLDKLTFLTVPHVSVVTRVEIIFPSTQQWLGTEFLCLLNWRATKV